jgi:hypothetical protein
VRDATWGHAGQNAVSTCNSDRVERHAKRIRHDLRGMVRVPWPISCCRRE